MTPPPGRKRSSQTPDPKPPERPAAAEQDHPPIFGTWRRLYVAVLVNLAILIALFYLFSRAFR